MFERLTVHILKTHPLYASTIDKVWLLRDGVPSTLKTKLNLPNTDEGIDIIAQTFTGAYWAIQCKFKSSKDAPTMRELSTFNNLAHTHCKHISMAMLFHTGERGVRKKSLMGSKYSEVGLEFWLGLSSQDWNRIEQASKSKKLKPQKRNPRDHQQKAIKQAQKHYINDKASRGRLIMPCGTGKSLTAFWIANSLKAKSVIVAVPSLSLIKQSLEDWTAEFIALNENPRPEWLVICSDDSTSKVQDEFVNDVYSLGIPTTTNVDEISSFLKRRTKGRKIVFTTYQSSDRLARASRTAKFAFDLAILDEAHKTVGVKSKAFATLLSDKNISIRKRMFMTATERVLKGTNDDVLSMDDESVYGKRFYQLTFKDAIHAVPQIISDYKILTIAVSSSQIQDIIRKNKFLSDHKKKIEEQDAQSLAAAIALRQATKQYGIKHAISFHRSIKAAESFTLLNQRLNTSKVDSVHLSSYHISSQKSAGQRSQLLEDFKNDKLALMTNARCLTEGVNVPTIDCVLFADPKQSIIDIVQAAGRALRVSPNKQYGYIMMPLIVPDNMGLEEFSESTPFKQVAKIVAALSTQDERIVEEFRLKHEGKKLSERRIEVSGSVPAGLKFDVSAFSESIQSRIWEKVGRANWRSFEEAKNYIHTLKFKRETDWRIYSKSIQKPSDIPAKPSDVYKNKGWINMGDWLGTGREATRNRKYLRFNQAKEIIHSLKLKNEKEWREYTKSSSMPISIPAAPQSIYKDEWKGMGDWLGTNTIAPHKKQFMSFIEAKAFISKFKFKNQKEFKEYCKSNLRPTNFPSNPNVTYADQGWISYGDFLGNGSIAPGKQEYLDFVEARSFVRKLELKTKNEWSQFCKSSQFPQNVPKAPNYIYRNKGWKNMADWLGNGKLSREEVPYKTFLIARKFARSLKLKTQKEWYAYCKNGLKPLDIPRNPERVYKADGWLGYGDWLGSGIVANQNKQFLPYEAAKKIVARLGLKSQKEWKILCAKGKRPAGIPSDPYSHYSNKGWKDWVDFLGKK